MGQLYVNADLSISVDGESVSVRSEGEALVATFQSISRALRVLKALPFPGGPGRRAALRSATGTATVAGLDVLIRIGKHTIARAGPAARPGLVSRLLCLGNVEVFLRPLVLAAFGR